VERKLRPARPKKGKKPRNRPDGQVSASKHLSVLAARGVRIEDPRTTFVAPEATVEPGATLRPFVVVEGRSVVRAGAMVGPFVRLVNAEIGENAQVFDHCLILESAVAARAQVGPFTHIRPGSHVGDGARVGNFVELKKARLGAGAKANHLAYLGDAEIGERTNIGAGTITCNYDGTRKHPTTIGRGAFVGSNSTLVAPITIGDASYVAAGSAITEDVPADALAIGRSRQENKPGWAAKRRAAEPAKPHS
jgi:bifunctional UDP-N-acetylglucosamine pyrophosphorylase / glucosamine-1-phosphate N-acetyltransferase